MVSSVAGTSTPARAPVRGVVLGPGAAIAGWLAVLVGLNLTGDPLVAGATFAGLALLAAWTGRRHLVAIALVVGAGMLVVIPGVAVVDGSFAITYASGARVAPTGGEGWALAVLGALRIPAQVLAAVFLAAVPAELLLARVGRVSPDGALLGGLAARLRPLLARDLRLLRDELASRGLWAGRGAPLARRLRGATALWEGAVSGMVDRAFQTSAALETRGWGASRRPTTESLRHRELGGIGSASPRVDACVLVAAVSFVATVVWARATGMLEAPSMHVLAGATQPVTPAAVLVALAGGSLGLVALLPSHPPTASGAGVRALPASGPAQHPAELVVDGVSMHYPGASAPSIVDASLRVAPGELVLVAGASGSGKSTLLDVVTGVAPRATGGHRRGTVRLGDHVVDATARLDGARIAAVFQDPESQVLVGRVAEEVAFGLRQAGLPVDLIEARVLSALDRLAVRHLAARDCATLSGGELQRVLLAAALALEPVLLVLDEPTSQVDAASERRFWDALDAARRELGIGVLAAEHRFDHVLPRADRVVVFESGRVVASIMPADLSSVAPWLDVDAYAGLVPNPAAVDLPARLVVALDRVDVSSPGQSPRTLLRGLRFAVPARGIVTLEGPNGAGKSTVLRAIRGLHGAPGSVLVDGHPRRDVAASIAHIAFLSQGAGALVPGRTVRHAVEGTCRELGIPTVHAHAALRAAGLADRVDSHPGELSVGERQRLALVAATAHRPPVWLLDEPTRGMDAAARRWVACHALAHAATGGVVLVATHDPAFAAAIATHRLRLDLRTGPSLVAVPRDAAGRLLVDDGTSGSHAVPSEVEA